MKEIEYVVSVVGLLLRVRSSRTEAEIQRHHSRIERWFYRSIIRHPTWEIVRPPEIRLGEIDEVSIRDRRVVMVSALAIDCEDRDHAQSVRHALADRPYQSVRVACFESLPAVGLDSIATLSTISVRRERRKIRD